MSNPKGFKGSRILPPDGYCGIDPGHSSGGIGYVTDDGFAMAWKMPQTEADLWDLIARISRVAVLFVLEKVHSMPKQGVSSTFKFGQNYGALRMALTAAEVRREFPTPQGWQGKMQCRTKGDKNVTKRKAQELWPKLTITHAIADALLLAEYGRRFGNVLRVARQSA